MDYSFVILWTIISELLKCFGVLEGVVSILFIAVVSEVALHVVS